MKVLFVLLLSFVLISGYSQDPELVQRGPRPPIDLNKVPPSAYEKNKISLKFKPIVANLLSAPPKMDNDGCLKFGIPAIDSLNQKYRVIKYEKLFQAVLDDCENCSVHRAWGFHLWCSFEFEENIDPKVVVKAYSGLTAIVEISELVYKIQRYSQVLPPSQTESVPDLKLDFATNDPRYPEQWNLHNSGQQGGLLGKDIKAQQAWDLSKGIQQVIVGVIDGGVDARHPDLEASMWPGWGYNFVNQNDFLDVDEHGTHTAGVVGAVTNNGMGISGVAGGDGSAGSGIRIMSLEVFGPSSNALDFGAPFVWSADRGAVISQNSWGYSAEGVYQQSILDGIDYFITHGGGSVLNGGLVLFAAGNSNSESNYYPAYYNQVLAVAATNNRDVRSYYSNFGNWVDISAPGGEQSSGNDPKGILSTVPMKINNGYEFLQGTSMACPQVSGAAALVVSKAPGRLSADDLKSILLTTTDNHYPENTTIYKGKLGTGRLNAYKAVQIADLISKTPFVSPVNTFNAQIKCPDVLLSWQKNNAADEVLVAYHPEGLFGLPTGHYSQGDSIVGGGVVIYAGNADFFLQAIPKDSASLVYKIWSKNTSGIYSSGAIARVMSPFSIISFSGASDMSQVNLNWSRTCHAGEVLVVFSADNNVGAPYPGIKVGDSLLGGGVVIYKGNLNSCSHLTPSVGMNHYKIFVYNFDGYSQIGLPVDVCYGNIAGPVLESFESPEFPPKGWQVINKNQGTITWERSINNGKSNTSSAQIRFYSYASGIGHQDYLVSPNMKVGNADSIIVSYDRAYRRYSTSGTNMDTLELVLSTDCGNSYQTIWRKGGVQLSTNSSPYTGNYLPADSDWQNTRIDIKPLVGKAEAFLIAFRSINNYGQNLYIDNIQLYTKEIASQDASILSIHDPLPRSCLKSFTPKLELVNLGKDTLKSVKVYFQLIGPFNYLDSVFYINPYLAKGGTSLVRFKPITIPIGGNYKVMAYTSLPNGVADQLKNNDTLQYDMTIFDPQPLPLREDFESTAFPPAQWYASTSNLGFNWEKSTVAASRNRQSAWVRNYRFTGGNIKQELYSPLMEFSKVDSVQIYFDLAYAFIPSMGPVQFSDSLEVLISTDCGAGFLPVYKKSGGELSTFQSNIPVYSTGQDTLGSIPIQASQWRKEKIDLTPFLKNEGSFQVMFRNSSQHVNNLFIDNVEFNAIKIPAVLQTTGLLIAPNPFRNSFVIRHLSRPADLRAIVLMDTEGRTMMQKNYSGDAPSFISMDLTQYAEGQYQVKLIYENRVIVKKIIKLP